MLNYDTYSTISNLEEHIGSTVHIVELGVLYCNVVIDGITPTTIHAEGKSFDRGNSVVFLVKKFVPEFVRGDIVKVTHMHGKELATPVKGIITDIDNDQGGGWYAYLVVPDTTAEVRDIKREHNEAPAHEYIQGTVEFDGYWT